MLGGTSDVLQEDKDAIYKQTRRDRRVSKRDNASLRYRFFRYHLPPRNFHAVVSLDCGVASSVITRASHGRFFPRGRREAGGEGGIGLTREISFSKYWNSNTGATACMHAARVYSLSHGCCELVYSSSLSLVLPVKLYTYTYIHMHACIYISPPDVSRENTHLFAII